MQSSDSIVLPKNFPERSDQIDLLKSNLVATVSSVDLFNLSKPLATKKIANLDAKAKAIAWEKWRQRVCVSAEWVRSRRKKLPKVTYPDLPVGERVDEIKALIEQHQVVIIAGETGSGKTTQIPKICLQAGRGVCGLIGHTQPRRIAARTVAERIAQELNSTLGDAVGYQVRFSDQTSPQSFIKLMTDGILLAEIQRDRYLSKYDTIIVDEAHERSLNIDFLLGYLKKLLVIRPDLKLIITSATIDINKFSSHFDNAPVVEVSGRT
jgi:ATP-dependent helicase HrpA